MIYLLIGYMWLFIHRPFEEWPWLGALRIERVYMIMTISYWMISGPVLSRWNRLYTGFALLTAVVTASWLTSPYQALGQPVFEDYLKYVVFFVLLVTSVRNNRDLRLILLGYVCVMGIFMAHSMREAFGGRILWSSMGIHRMVGVGVTFSHPNDFAGLITMSLPFAYPLWMEARKRWQQLAVLGYVGLTVWCVIRTNSRMAMCGVLLAGLMFVLGSQPRWRWRLVALAPLLLVGVWMALPQQTQDRFWTLIDPESGNVAAQSSAGNYRFGGFQRGLHLMGERPLLGYGPGGSRVGGGVGTQTHNTYGQLLGELGMAGAVAFLMIVYGVAQNVLQARRAALYLDWTDDPLPYRMVLAASAAYVLALFMGWGLHFFFWHIWLWFGAFQAVAFGCLQQQIEAHDAVEWSPEPLECETQVTTPV